MEGHAELTEKRKQYFHNGKIKYSINRRLVDMTDKLIEAESKKLKRNDKINDKTEYVGMNHFTITAIQIEK